MAWGVSEEELRQRLEELLKPGGEPLGQPKRTGGKVRRVSEEESEAAELFSRLAALGWEANIPNYPGPRVEIPGLGYVGYRQKSKSGPPTIDVGVSIDGLRDAKFKYVGREGS